MKKMLSFLLSLCLMFSLATPVWGYEENGSGLDHTAKMQLNRNGQVEMQSPESLTSRSEGDLSDTSTENSPEGTLEKVFSLLNDKQYYEYAALTDVIAKEENVEEGILSQRGFFNLKSVSLTRYKDITSIPDAYSWLIEIETIQDAGYSDIHIYTVELDCSTYHQDKFFVDGLNYFMAAIGFDGNNYRLVQFSQPLWAEVPVEARFTGIDESVIIFIQNERLKGNIIGSDGSLRSVNRASAMGETFDLPAELQETIPDSDDPNLIYQGTNGMTVKEYLLSLPQPYEATEIDFPEAYPGTITIYIVSEGRIVHDSFHLYVANVLSNEWTAYENDGWHGMPDEAFDAGTVATKQFGWWRILIPKYAGQGYDVKNTQADQVYVPGTDIASAASESYNRMDTYAIENSDGKMFLTEYRAGTYDDAGESDGYLYQNGAAYLAKRDYNALEILRYYYGYSSKTGDPNSGRLQWHRYHNY